jgi:hypothetical protein
MSQKTQSSAPRPPPSDILAVDAALS